MGMIPGGRIEKTFTASEFGGRVGWVRVKEFDEHPYVAIDVVTAEVTEEVGAEFGVKFWKNEETDVQESSDQPYARGFGKVAAFSAFLSREADRREESNLHYTAEGMTYPTYRPDAEDLLARGTGDNRHVEDTEKIWANGPSELLQTMHDILTKLDFESAYAIMYYLLNGAIAQDGMMTSALTGIEPRSLLMPDPNMRQVTTQQLALVRDMSSSYSESIQNDMNMRHRITGFIDDTPRKGIPDRFVESRQKAAALEVKVSNAADKLVLRRLAYVPVGHGRAGRTWPYMDAVEPDADKAYGLELRDLRARKIDRAVHELDQEITELEARQALALGALQRLEILSQAEQAA